MGVLTGTMGGNMDITPLLMSDYLGQPVAGILVDEDNKIIASTEKFELGLVLDRNTALVYEEYKQIFMEAIAAADGFTYVSMDVNELKIVNDSMGHAAGDELLKGAASCMQQCFAEYGKLYRMGGDEFAAIIVVNDGKLAWLKQNFEETVSKWKGESLESLSVSCGYATQKEFPDKKLWNWQILRMTECMKPSRHITGQRA